MNNPRTAWIVYIVLRLLFFAVPFAVLYLIGIQPWLAAIFAALIGVALSVIFLARSRSTASESIYDWRNRDRTADDIVEDEAIAAEGKAEASADERGSQNAAERTDQNAGADPQRNAHAGTEQNARSVSDPDPRP